jgi:hypothetical protein
MRRLRDLGSRWHNVPNHRRPGVKHAPERYGGARSNPGVLLLPRQPLNNQGQSGHVALVPPRWRDNPRQSGRLIRVPPERCAAERRTRDRTPHDEAKVCILHCLPCLGVVGTCTLDEHAIDFRREVVNALAHVGIAGAPSFRPV